MSKTPFAVAFVVTTALGAMPGIAQSVSDPVLDATDAATVDPVAPLQSPAEAMAALAAQDPALEATSNAEGEIDGMVMLSDVLFDYKEASLAPEAIATLQVIASKMDNVAALEVVGHTDSIGSNRYNQELGQERADAVVAWLVAEGGIDPDAVTAISAGESDPIAANLTDAGADNPEGRALNRRVEFRILEVAVQEALPEPLVEPVQSLSSAIEILPNLRLPVTLASVQ